MGVERSIEMHLPMPDYLHYPAYSSSQIAYASESMAKLQRYRQGRIQFDSKALNFGSMVHLKLQDEAMFYDAYQVRPYGLDKRTKEGKAWFAKLEAEGRIVVDNEDWERVHAMADEYRQHEDFLIRMVQDSEGENESSYFWTENGLPMKCRSDRIIRPSPEDCEVLCERFPSLFRVPFGISICVDFKTSGRPVHRHSFKKTMEHFQYDLKASHYLVGTGCDAFMFVAMETSEPFTIARYLVCAERMAECKALREKLVAKIVKCEESGEWPTLQLSDAETLI